VFSTASLGRYIVSVRTVSQIRTLPMLDLIDVSMLRVDTVNES